MKNKLDIKTKRIIGEVIESNLNYLVRFATIRTGSKADGEDVVHEAVRRFLETDISQIRRDRMRMYLFRIVYNLCTDFHVCARSIRTLSQADEEIPAATNDEELDYEEIERLNRLLDFLPEREAEIVRMNVIDELSFVEISHILSAPESTVKSRFKSGIEKLRKQYFKKQ